MCGRVKLDGHGAAATRREAAVQAGCAVRLRFLPLSTTGFATVNPIEIRSGHDEPLLFEPESGTEVVECAGPDGVSGSAAREVVRAAVTAPADGPPLCQASYLMGRVQEAAGDHQAALASYLKAAALFPFDKNAAADAQKRADALRAEHAGLIVP